MPLQSADRVLGFEHGIPTWLVLLVGAIGLAWLLLGWKLHRITLVVAGAMAGAFAGSLLAAWAGVARGWGIGAGIVVMSLLALPLWRVSVFLLAGLAGGLALGQLLHRFLHAGIFWWGFLGGFILAGLLSIRYLRALVIVATSMLGAQLLAWSVCQVLGRSLLPILRHFDSIHPLSWSIIVSLLALVGAVVQFRYGPRRLTVSEE
ncbi:MAG: hypothetical protein DRI34_01455 [Deltaproteobacteria bacterium]|nr:MAG: hypothetical protein DRI34_01455 [Deltaproteobacteria bacterium]